MRERKQQKQLIKNELRKQFDYRYPVNDYKYRFQEQQPYEQPQEIPIADKAAPAAAQEIQQEIPHEIQQPVYNPRRNIFADII